MLTDLSRRDSLGRAFGVERAGDNLGAIMGPLLASALVGVLGVRWTMLLALIPGLLAAAAITVAVREAGATLSESAARKRFTLNLRGLRRAGLARVLAPIACFELGNLATTLLILRATDVLAASGWAAASAASVAGAVGRGPTLSARLAAQQSKPDTITTHHTL